MTFEEIEEIYKITEVAKDYLNLEDEFVLDKIFLQKEEEDNLSMYFIYKDKIYLIERKTTEDGYENYDLIEDGSTLEEYLEFREMMVNKYL